MQMKWIFVIRTINNCLINQIAFDNYSGDILPIKTIQMNSSDNIVGMIKSIE
jgi:hypothetical protein